MRMKSAADRYILASGYLETMCISFIFEKQQKIYPPIKLISEPGAYLDVSFLALSEDKFLIVTKRMGDYSRSLAIKMKK